MSRTQELMREARVGDFKTTLKKRTKTARRLRDSKRAGRIKPQEVKNFLSRTQGELDSTLERLQKDLPEESLEEMVQLREQFEQLLERCFPLEVKKEGTT